MIRAILVWIMVSKLISAGLRYRIAARNGDAPTALKESDRLGGALGFLAFLGVLAGPAISKALKGMREP